MFLQELYHDFRRCIVNVKNIRGLDLKFHQEKQPPPPQGTKTMTSLYWQNKDVFVYGRDSHEDYYLETPQL
jgi:hypothetical protein